MRTHSEQGANCSLWWKCALWYTVHYTAVRAFANIFPNIFAKKKGVVATCLVMTIY